MNPHRSLWIPHAVGSLGVRGMAKAVISLMCLCVSFVVLLGCEAQCQPQQLGPRPPTLRFHSEAGFTEYWYAITEEFMCAGIEFVRYNVDAKGLVLPYYSNTPHLIFILQGSGILGAVIPGCASTYESETGSMRHQKLRRFSQGDFLALPEGITTFIYNDGDAPLTYVSLLDIANEDNQLGLKYRKFFLGGNPQSLRVSPVSPGTRIGGMGGRAGRQEARNIFYGFDDQILAQAFGAHAALMRKVKGTDDRRGTIVRANNMSMVVAPDWGNSIQDVYCSYKIIKNLDRPSGTDLYIPGGGRISNLNTHILPILKHIHLSAQRGMLYRNASVVPKWSSNAHAIIYVTRGNAMIQVVGRHGRLVFNGVMNAGQLLVVPPNSVVVKRAGNGGFEWITFYTTDNATNVQHTSGMPTPSTTSPSSVS